MNVSTYYTFSIMQFLLSFKPAIRNPFFDVYCDTTHENLKRERERERERESERKRERESQGEREPERARERETERERERKQ